MTAQNADMESINSGSFFSPKNEYKILATKNGFVSYNSTEEIGMVSLLLGAGRLSKTDPLDFSAGI
jgi:thymidine phosphorylase